MKQIIVVGAGMAGLWATIGAARARKLFGKTEELQIMLINNKNYHSLRPCNYEEDLQRFTYPLPQIMNLIHTDLLIDTVLSINPKKKQIVTEQANYSYDALVLATGSYLAVAPELQAHPHVFNIDTYETAQQLNQHLAHLNKQVKPGAFTAIVVGAGFCGLEIAAELPTRLQKIASPLNKEHEVKVVLLDRHEIGHALGENPRKAIIQALDELGITMLSNVTITRVDDEGIILNNGMTIPTQTIIETTGLKASPLTTCFNLPLTSQGQIEVNQYLQIPQFPQHYAVGDVAHARVDATHFALMSCQHARPQGRIGGYNVVADLYNIEPISYTQEEYVTCLDLGPWGALYTTGWERNVVATREEGKKIKMYINHDRIGPTLPLSEKSLFAAAEPTIQAVPSPNNKGNHSLRT